MFTRPVGLHYAKTGKAQQVATVPWISTDFTSFSSALGENLGQPWFDDFGNTFILKVARASAIVLGNILEINAPGTDTALTASTTRVMLLTTGGLTAGAEVNNWVYEAIIAKGSNKTDGVKLIKGNAAGSLTVSNLDTKYGNLQADPDAYVVAPANTDAVAIIRPYEVILFATASAVIFPPVGVSAQAITQNAYGFTQTEGLALTTWDGVAAIVAKNCVIASAATAGQIKPGGVTWLTYAVGIAACANASTGTAGTLVPVWIGRGGGAAY